MKDERPEWFNREITLHKYIDETVNELLRRSAENNDLSMCYAIPFMWCECIDANVDENYSEEDEFITGCWVVILREFRPEECTRVFGYWWDEKVIEPRLEFLEHLKSLYDEDIKMLDLFESLADKTKYA